MEEKIRINKYLAGAGIASLRASDRLVAEGRVKINGIKAVLGDKIDPKKDKVAVNGKKIVLPKSKASRYIMLYKPRGWVTTLKDELGRKCVADIFAGERERLFPVGRLDKDSEGLLLMTTDGQLANHLTHPSSHISKTYRVTIKGVVSEEATAQLTAGVMLEDGITQRTEVRTVTAQAERTVLEIVLFEGRNRQIRRMCEALGLEVSRLKRTAVGGLTLGMLAPGKWRELDEKEIKKLKAMMSAV
jgi:23S rRNA pseudouridine2605 synthase